MQYHFISRECENEIAEEFFVKFEYDYVSWNLIALFHEKERERESKPKGWDFDMQRHKHVDIKKYSFKFSYFQKFSTHTLHRKRHFNQSISLSHTPCLSANGIEAAIILCFCFVIKINLNLTLQFRSQLETPFDIHTEIYCSRWGRWMILKRNIESVSFQ